MAYPRRITPPGVVFHVLNRAVQRRTLFERDEDYRAFLRCVWEAHAAVQVSIFAFCVMPNHFHFVMTAAEDGQISRFMARLTATHSKRWHQHQRTVGTGSVYQGRFKTFPVQTESYFYNVCRYVEGNALRAGLVPRAEHWLWSSLGQQVSAFAVPISPWPLARPDQWIDLVNVQRVDEVSMMRSCVNSGRPLGHSAWVASTEDRIGLARKRG
jgi:putative transposase